VGVLIKGPLILLFIVLAIVALAVTDRSVRWIGALKPIPGVLWLAALVLPWFIAIMGRAGNAFFAESVGQDFLAKIFSAQESHGAPPGYYALLFWLTFWPGATLAAMAAPGIWAVKHEKGAKFLLAWIVPAWILLELVITKLPHYVLPLYPAIAILIAGVIDSRMLSRRPWVGHGTVGWFVVPTVLGIGAVVALIIFGRQLGLVAWPFIAASMIYGLWAWWLFSHSAAVQSLLQATVASILLSAAVFGVIIPSMGTAFPSSTLAQIVRDANCDAPMIATAGYHEPSVVFLAGTDARLLDGSGAADFLRSGNCRFAFVESRHERAFLRRAEAIGLRYAPPQRVDGYNYSIGRAVSIGVYRAEDGR
jgi:4-amino-4-deoxy-L-arabinose transferase-like glycosyltransferase